jgi:hypothetical protein
VVVDRAASELVLGGRHSHVGIDDPELIGVPQQRRVLGARTKEGNAERDCNAESGARTFEKETAAFLLATRIDRFPVPLFRSGVPISRQSARVDTPQTPRHRPSVRLRRAFAHVECSA